MDEIVLRAMAKWPNVPAVYGWLALDRRGRWRLRDEPLTHLAVVEFINRNYAGDADGRWFFQNGPQRVYVALAYTPWVFSLDGAGALQTHTGVPAGTLQGAWLDDEGNLLLLTEHGPGVVDDRDLLALCDGFLDRHGDPCDDERLEEVFCEPRSVDDAGLEFQWQAQRVPLETLPLGEAPAHFGFDPDPRDAESEPRGGSPDSRARAR